MGRAFFINRNFLLLWLGQAFSSFGEFLVGSVVTVWLVSDLLNRDPGLPVALGLVAAASTLPRIFIAPLAGAWIDSARPVRVMLAADGVRILAAAMFMAVDSWAGLKPWESVFSVSLLLLINATAAQFFNPARACIMQIAIPTDRRVEASAKAMFSLTGVAILSAALGPLLFGWGGIMSAMALATLGLAGSGLCVILTRGMPGRVESETPSEPYWRSLASGIRLAWTHRTIRLMMIGTALYGISLGINNPVLPLFGMQTLKLEPADYGVLMAMFPLGGLSATLLSAWLSKRLRAEALTCGALFALGLANLAYALSRGDYEPLLTMYLSGLCFATYVVAQGPVLQRHVPASFMGRISSLSTPVLSVSSMLATAGVTAALVRVDAGSMRADAADPNALALSVSAVIVMVGAGMMMLSLSRSASGVETDAKPLQR